MLNRGPTTLSLDSAYALDQLGMPQTAPRELLLSEGMADGMSLLQGSSECVAVEIPRKGELFGASLRAIVSDSPEFSIAHTGDDSNLFRSSCNSELTQNGFPRALRELVIDHISGLFENFRDASLGSSHEAFLILRRPRARAHWHIDHYRPGAVQFVATLAGYPTTPFLLRGDYDQAEFERYRSLISRRDVECHGLSSDDPVLYQHKMGMNALAESATPRYVAGDLLFKGAELFHATPQSPVSRLLFAMSAVPPLA